MARGYKQIDGTFVDKNGRVVSSISAKKLRELIERGDGLEQALRDVSHMLRNEIIMTSDAGTKAILDAILTRATAELDKQLARRTP